MPFKVQLPSFPPPPSTFSFAEMKQKPGLYRSATLSSRYLFYVDAAGGIVQFGTSEGLRVLPVGSGWEQGSDRFVAITSTLTIPSMVFQPGPLAPTLRVPADVPPLKE